MLRKSILTFILSLSLAFNANSATIKGAWRTIYQTNKTITISGPIDPYMVNSVHIQLMATHDLAGPTVVLIASPGGYVDSGIEIIKMLQKEKKETRQPLVCVVMGEAHSMAFNILTQCDVRLATPNSRLVAHKIAVGGIEQRMTAKNMRKLADELDKIDVMLDAMNAAALHMTVGEYSKYADKDYAWTVKELIARRYIKEAVEVTP